MTRPGHLSATSTGRFFVWVLEKQKRSADVALLPFPVPHGTSFAPGAGADRVEPFAQVEIQGWIGLAFLV